MTSVPAQLSLFDTPIRHCHGCQRDLPLTEFHVRPDLRSGFATRCKACVNARQYAWRRKQPKKTPPYLDTEKECRECKRVLPMDAFDWFGKGPNRKPKRCRDCFKLAKARGRERQSDHRKAYNREYYRQNKEKVGTRIKLTNAANPEKYRVIHTRWKRENKDAVNASTHKRRARLRHNGGSWTEQDWQRLKARYDWRCLMCRRQEPEIVLCFDHVIPLDMGGFNIISNGQPLCRSCNSKKHRNFLDLRPNFYREWP